MADELAADPSIRAVLVRAEGNVFSFGGDVTGLLPPNVLKRLRDRMGNS